MRGCGDDMWSIGASERDSEGGNTFSIFDSHFRNVMAKKVRSTRLSGLNLDFCVRSQ